MLKTKVRLDAEERQMLQRLAPAFGGQDAVVREAVRRLAADYDREQAFKAFLKAWDEEDGPLTDEEIAAVATRCGL